MLLEVKIQILYSFSRLIYFPIKHTRQKCSKGTNEMNNALKNEYKKMIDKGYQNIIYIESPML